MMETTFRANEDRISQLPIELIHLILSFMDAKFAVRTSTLSKRWKLIWKSLPHLNFHSVFFHRKDIFIKFVRYVLSRHDNNAGISSINYISNSISVPVAQRIIRYAISQNCEHLTIDGCPWPVKNWVRYSPLIFSSPHLKQLCLSVNVEVLDTSWNFPALTSLEIQHVHFKSLSGENSKKSANPFSRLLSLKELVLTHCNYTGVEVINIASPGLMKLNISTRDYEKTKFMLSTPNLSSFTYKGDFPIFLLASDLHCLEYVDIHIPYSTFIMTLVDRRFVGEMISMFRQLSCSVSLRLSFDILELLHAVPEMIKHERSPFCNLKCLKLVHRPYSFPSTIYTDAVIYLLSCSPAATVLVETGREL